MADVEKKSESLGDAVLVEDNLDTLLYDEDGHLRKLPIPSSDPNDPLNFTVWRHRLILAAVTIYGIAAFGLVQSTPLFFGKLIPEYMAQTHGTFDPARIADLASYPSLCMGLGNFLFVPLSMALGRRGALLLSNTILLGAVIWAAKSTSFESHLGARCLQGLTAGVADCLLPIIVLDISFLHRRGARLVVYWTSTAVGSSLLLVAVPFIVDHADGDWRVSYWFWTAFVALSLILVTFCLPETLFHRRATSFRGQIHATDTYGTHRVFYTAEDATAAGFVIDDGSNGDPQVTAEKSYRRQFAPIHLQRPGPFGRFVRAYREIFLCLIIPGTLWVLALNSILFGGIVVLSLTYSQQLEMAPWHFSPSSVGTVQVGSAIGSLAALLIGSFAEPISGYFTRRNKGIREPEHILPNFILPSILVFAGLTLYGVVGAHPEKYSWVGIHAAFALFYCGFCAISAMTGMWLGELLPTMSGPAIVLACGGRNAVAFGFGDSLHGWIADIGFFETHVMMGGILLLLACFLFPLYFFNRRIRKAMASLRWLK
ncbi:major facilitator superfamily domain-containing protein [Ilyonectria robusta]|uniref:major facilitator superfamily domain-containing protein n=1 Tax=Ilyonectria robusta TaxID=1079257 RepID=UPI001E8E760A|nr:major facilitator superfamily domain-containing protein [Ilyonectria robusta]KAH8683789.1 major facilitator superfamily domain-containing protein [Ilyonectria robusta]